MVALFLVFASKFGASGAFWHMIAAAGCDAARAAGVAPAYRGHPGYHARNDRDGDGIACEPYYGRTRMGGPVTKHAPVGDATSRFVGGAKFVRPTP